MRRYLYAIAILAATAAAVWAAPTATWDATFETGTFNDSTQVNQLDDQLDIVLETIRDHAEVEHCWGGDATGCNPGDSGRAREGSARAWHVPDCSAITALYVNDADSTATLGAGDDGRFCIDSDTGETYYWTGSAWELLAPAFKGVLLRKSGAESISTATDSIVGFDTEVYDVGTWHDPAATTCTYGSSAGCRVTVPSNVERVTASCRVQYVPNATGYRQVGIFLNGAATVPSYYEQVPGNAGNNGYAEVTTAPLSVSAGDTIECYTYQTSGGNLNVSTGTSFSVQAVH